MPPLRQPWEPSAVSPQNQTLPKGEGPRSDRPEDSAPLSFKRVAPADTEFAFRAPAEVVGIREHQYRRSHGGCILLGVDEKRNRSVVLGDSRDDGRFLRVTWHPITHTVVFSHWNGTVCTASTPVKLLEASKVIDLLVAALAELAKVASEPSTPTERSSRWMSGPLAQRLLRRLRPAGATVLRMASASRKSPASGTGA